MSSTPDVLAYCSKRVKEDLGIDATEILTTATENSLKEPLELKRAGQCAEYTLLSIKNLVLTMYCDIFKSADLPITRLAAENLAFTALSEIILHFSEYANAADLRIDINRFLYAEVVFDVKAHRMDYARHLRHTAVLVCALALSRTLNNLKSLDKDIGSMTSFELETALKEQMDSKTIVYEMVKLHPSSTSF